MTSTDPRILTYQGTTPQLGARVFIADNARVIGDTHLGDEVSVWFGTVVRGDVFHIRVGRRTNLQDHTVVHVTSGRHATIIGDEVTVGHRATLHGCTVEDQALIGMGATVMDGAVVGARAMVGAGALVTPGTIIPPGTLAIGTPARPKRDLTDEELAYLSESAAHYVALAGRYMQGARAR